MRYTYIRASPNLYAGRFRVTNLILNILDNANKTRIHKYSPHCKGFYNIVYLWPPQPASGYITQAYSFILSTTLECINQNSHRISTLSIYPIRCRNRHHAKTNSHFSNRNNSHVSENNCTWYSKRFSIHPRSSTTSFISTFQHCIWVTTAARTVTGHVEWSQVSKLAYQLTGCCSLSTRAS
jgi:hypothetical protein